MSTPLKRAAPPKAAQPAKRAKQEELTESTANSGGILGPSAIRALAVELRADAAHVQRCLGLLTAGHTVPFIARYRAHETGGMEPPLLRRIEAAARDAASLAARCDSVVATLRKAERLSAELEAELRAAPTLAALEAAYAPHKAKPCSLAERARALGCEPAALAVWGGMVDDAGLRRLLRTAAAGGKASETELKEGVQRMLAELVARSGPVRKAAMQRFERSALVRCSAVAAGGGSKGAAASAAGAKKGGGKSSANKDKGAVAGSGGPGGGSGGDVSENFRDYLDFSRPLSQVSSHAWLAMHRGAEQKAPRARTAVGRARLGRPAFRAP